MDSVSRWIWNEGFWLPEGYSWEDLTPTKEVVRAQFSDLYNVPFIALAVVLIRFAFERYVALPFCKYIGISDHGKPPKPNLILEKVFSTDTTNPVEERILGLAKQLGWSTQKVERWFMKRRNQAKSSLLSKATESCWRCLFYFGLFIYGCVTLMPTDWFYDTRQWIVGYIRHHNFTPQLKWYILMEFAFYTSLLFSQFLDTKRKDFWQMFLHHVITLAMIFCCYAISHIRIGVAIMFLHDAADYWLEAAKIANYAKKQKICDSLFVVFAFVFYITRWIYFPFWVIYSFFTYSTEVLGTYPAFYAFSFLLSTLQVLHLYWGLLIAKMVYKFTAVGKVEKDTRSEDEGSEDERDRASASANHVKKKK